MEASMLCSQTLSVAAFPWILGQRTRSRILQCMPRSTSHRRIKEEEEDEEDDSKTTRSNSVRFAAATTMTVISLSLPPQASANTATATATKKAPSFMTPEERKAWAEGLPVVQTKLPYSDILTLRSEGRLKHVIKHPKSKAKATPDVVFLVVDDNRVFRSVLPASTDEAFWSQWDSLGIGKLVVNAYSPPIPRPSIPKHSVVRDLVSRLAKKLPFLAQPRQRQPKKPAAAVKKKKVSPVNEEYLRRKKEIEEQRKRLAEEREFLLKRPRFGSSTAPSTSSSTSTNQSRSLSLAERRQRRREEEELAKNKEGGRLWKEQLEANNAIWEAVIENESLMLLFAVVISIIFYNTVVLSYRKRRADYEDRKKIQQLEDEEMAKQRQLDREMDDALEMKKKGKVPDKETKKKNPFVESTIQFLDSGAKVRKAGISSRYLEKNVGVKFADVAGLGDIRKELEEIVDFFKYPERYLDRGAKIPTGILLCGEPGVGKTLLAKAVAGEAGASFLSISASQFVEMFVGVGASRVRGLYEEANRNAPAVVFIDELDAVGRQRGLIATSGGKERDNTVNQLLVCLDGFEGKGRVITIAATNRPDILDSALIRPGRFDRRIYIPLPGLTSRIQILEVHMKNKPKEENIDYAAVASATGTVSGAELANIVNKAALAVIRRGRKKITTNDLILAIQGDEAEPEGEYNSEFQMKFALNEAAMAVVAINFPDFKDIKMLSVAPLFQTGIGCVRMSMDETKFEVPTFSRQTVLDYITIQLASRAADEMWNGSDKLCTISAEMVDNARSAARWLILAGLSDKKELYGLCDCWHEAERLNEVDVEAMRILNICYDRAKRILQQNRVLMDATINELLKKQTIKKDDFLQLVIEHGNLDPIPSELIEIRKYKELKQQVLSITKEHKLGL